ncbi:hypothetical protein MIMGU_mgv1a017202mg [Erythranthe guttata]|uniref:Uncharacterized protein n=1 Tax=Erythranthe guttata TaxID=4155 RepID=A0A022RJ84_ERYGU|nr:PREDICTED: EC protein homolog 2-like [Erythranthe guttata]EYU40477.1 hypothetical protein MIMGU_mgv1a017202mg [Erythranthe guttata]|eukprot:XP_012833791.1 PREDICTED: EC protein homolog 2-like [Erythranthe guttata]
MSDMRGSAVVCDDRCGCPSPCPGGIGCRCASGEMAASGGDMEHKQCPCGEHCGCNPCNCSKTEQTTSGGTGKAFCRCGAGCTCPTCAA